MSGPNMPLIYTLFGFRLNANIINTFVFWIIIKINPIYY